MGGHLATNKMYETVMLGEWMGQKRKMTLNTALLKVCLGKLLASSEDFRSTIILTASFWITESINKDFTGSFPVSSKVTGCCLYY